MPEIYPRFEGPLPSTEVESYYFGGRSLSDSFEALDDIAIAQNLRSLSQMIDGGTMALEVFDEGELPANCPPVKWYSAAEGLETIDGLLAYFEMDAGRLPEQRDGIMMELRNLKSLLEEAGRLNIGFHLLVDM